VPHASNKTTKTVHWPPGPWGLNPPGWPLKGNGFPFIPPIGICGDWPPNGEFPNGFGFWPGLGKPANREAQWYFSHTFFRFKQQLGTGLYTQIKTFPRRIQEKVRNSQETLGKSHRKSIKKDFIRTSSLRNTRTLKPNVYTYSLEIPCKSNVDRQS